VGSARLLLVCHNFSFRFFCSIQKARETALLNILSQHFGLAIQSPQAKSSQNRKNNNMANALIRMIQLAAPVIHQHIVRTLANSTAFQRMAWHGTEAAKKVGKDGGEALKSTAAYRTASYKGMEQMTRLKQSEAYKEVDASGALRALGEFKQRIATELKESKKLFK